MQATIGLSASCESVLQGEPFKVGIAQLDSQVLDVSNQFYLGGFPCCTWDQQTPLMVMLNENTGVKLPELLASEIEEGHSLGNIHNQPCVVQESKKNANKLSMIPKILFTVYFTL